MCKIVSWLDHYNQNCNKVYFQEFGCANRLCKGSHDGVIKWKYFPRYWPFVRGIHRSLVNSAHKGQWRGALMLSLIRAWTNSWANNRDAGDLRRHRVHYDVTAMPNSSTSNEHFPPLITSYCIIHRKAASLCLVCPQTKHWNRNVVILIRLFLWHRRA